MRDCDFSFSFSSISSSSSSSSSSLYPSSHNSSASDLSPLSQRVAFQPRDYLESLITKHGYPTPVSLSSLRDLTATSSTYTPPSPHSDVVPVDTLDSLGFSPTKPIPIPRRETYEDLPVTPLTGRFNHTYFEDWERASQSARCYSESPPWNRSPLTSMRSDTSPYCSPVASPLMSPRRSISPQPKSKSKPSKTLFQLGNLPKFHPAVYQSSGSSHSANAQLPSPRQSRQSNYWTGPRDIMWQCQYRDPDLIEGTHSGPSAPRLDPLASPGPVTPLALEANDYLAHAVSNASDRTRDVAKQNAGPPPEYGKKKIAQEKNTRQVLKSATR